MGEGVDTFLEIWVPEIQVFWFIIKLKLTSTLAPKSLQMYMISVQGVARGTISVITYNVYWTPRGGCIEKNLLLCERAWSERAWKIVAFHILKLLFPSIFCYFQVSNDICIIHIVFTLIYQGRI